MLDENYEGDDENGEDDGCWMNLMKMMMRFVRLMVAVMKIIFYLSLNHKSTVSTLVGRMPLILTPCTPTLSLQGQFRYLCQSELPEFRLTCTPGSTPSARVIWCTCWPKKHLGLSRCDFCEG